MNKIPRYIDILLLRRHDYAEKLIKINDAIDAYAEKLGIDFNNTNGAFHNDVRIYTEPEDAFVDTRNAIIDKILENTK